MIVSTLDILDNVRQYVPKLRRWFLSRAARRPQQPSMDDFRHWVCAKTRLCIDQLIDKRGKEYRDKLHDFSAQHGTQRILQITPLTRGDFIAYIFAAFTEELRDKDEYSAISTFEFWDAMGPECAEVYTQANFDAINRVPVRRLMLLRKSARIRDVLTSRSDASAKEVRNRLDAHTSRVGSKNRGSYWCRYGLVARDTDYFRLRSQCHVGVFKFVFGEGPTYYLTLRPIYYGSEDHETSKTRLKHLDVRVYADPQELGDVLDAWSALKDSPQAALRAGTASINVDLRDTLTDVASWLTTPSS